ncbi:MAG: DUF1287 domain-containing protein [Bacteroidota bacterium]
MHIHCALPFMHLKKIFFLIFFSSLHLISFGQNDFFHKLSDVAITLTSLHVQYDPQYFVINYPNGDVPADKGVCTDVVIRAYRKMGIDLQKDVHADMIANFKAYPNLWNLSHTDSNIDHRRVPNLMKFFERKNTSLPITINAADYKPGDIVCWNLGKEITHIGIVVDRKSTDGKRNLIVHNIGGGQVIQDCLFQFTIIGHYRYKK